MAPFEPGNAVGQPQERICFDVRFRGETEFPSKGSAKVVEAIVNDDCTITVRPARIIDERDVPRGPRAGEQSRSIAGQVTGSKSDARSSADPEYHIMNQVIDRLAINLTSIQTDLYWTSDGSAITSGSGNNTARWHVEDTCYPPDGWHLQTLTGGQSSGGIGQSFVEWTGHAEWWYRGFFSACDPNTFYNSFSSWVRGYANGAPSYCGYSQYARASYSGWRFYVYCWDPYVTLLYQEVP